MPKGTSFVTREDLDNWDWEYLVGQCVDKVIECYEQKIERYKEQLGIDYSVIERHILLSVVDKYWIDHIDSMDKLKRGISLRGYANEDPINAYKREGMEMFEDMTASIQEETVRVLLNGEFNIEKPKTETKTYVASGGSLPTANRPVQAQKKVGRNDPCPCGSGKKYKNCCGKNA